MRGVRAEGVAQLGEVFRRVYEVLGFGRVVTLTRLPGVTQMLDLGYRWLAKNRYRFTGRCADRGCLVARSSPHSHKKGAVS